MIVDSGSLAGRVVEVPRSSAMNGGVASPVSLRVVMVRSGSVMLRAFSPSRPSSGTASGPQYFSMPALIRSMVRGFSGRVRSPIRVPVLVRSRKLEAGSTTGSTTSWQTRHWYRYWAR